MKVNYKKILLFVFILLLWCLSGLLFRVNTEFYDMLKLPSFTLDGKYISIIWFVIYILNTTSIILIINKKNMFKEYDYMYILFTNYFANQLFMYLFFYLMSPFLGFIMTIIIFVSSIFLFIETNKLYKKSSYFLIPYIIYNIYAVILMTSIYFMNF